MTVKELIEQLQTLDPDLHVFVSGYEGGYKYVELENEIMEIALDVHDEWWYGKHEDADSSYFVPDKIVKGIVL